MLLPASVHSAYRCDSGRSSPEAFVGLYDIGRVLTSSRTDILNILNPSSQKSKGTFRQRRDYHERMEDARHFSKYLFPREHGLATAFASGRAHKYPDFADREDEIKVRAECVPLCWHLFRYHIKTARKSKTPKRVKSMLDLLERIIYRHGYCSYIALRDVTCPSKLKRPEQEAALDASVILVCLLRDVGPWRMHLIIAQELLSEESIHMSSQRTTSFLNTSLEPSCPSTEDSKCKPRFAEFACSFVEVISQMFATGLLMCSTVLVQVFRFAVVVTKAVVPMSFWGGDENFRVVMNGKTYLRCLGLSNCTPQL